MRKEAETLEILIPTMAFRWDLGKLIPPKFNCRVIPQVSDNGETRYNLLLPDGRYEPLKEGDVVVKYNYKYYGVLVE
jgi:hypothetical protein